MDSLAAHGKEGEMELKLFRQTVRLSSSSVSKTE
jgi:hypothetical protein